MKYHHELRYDATPEEVYAMLADPDFRERVCAAQQAPDPRIVIDSGEGTMSVRVDQSRPSGQLPGFARKIVGDTIDIVQREEWSGPERAILVVVIPGKPVRLEGTIALLSKDRGCVEVVDGNLTVNIPLLAGKVERLISDLLDTALEAEHDVGRARLAGRS